MRKFFFTVCAILITTTAWSAPQFTITCENTAGDGCTITGNYSNLVVNHCKDIANKKITKDAPILIDVSISGDICADEIKKARQATDCPDNDILLRYVDNYAIFFCESGDYLDTLGTTYDGINDANWTYNQKRCVGSGGKYENNQCTCPNDQTIPENGECVCKNGNQKYLVNGNCQEGVACTNTGETPVSGGSQCICPADRNMETGKIRTDSDVEMCRCKNGYQYRDPMRRWEGCVKINDTVTISGTIVSHDNQNETLPGVNLAVNDASLSLPKGTTTDINGKFQLDKVPNTAYITISSVGFKQQIRPAIELNNATIKLVPTPQKLGEVEVKEISECTKTGGTTNDGGKTCDCPDGFTTETINENAQKCVPAPEPMVATEPAHEQEPSTDEPTYTPSADELAQKLKSAQENLTTARDKENSWANRGLTAASTAATGLGTMAAASAIAEQRSDAEAEKQMRAYIETMQCEYGAGQTVKLSNEETTLPGGNELLEYYTEYKSLADELKQTKTALGLRPGIESETLYDRAQTGLYQYASTGKTGGAETSLYRALTDSESADATAWAEQKDASDKKLKTGAIVAGAGIVGGIVGNYLINERGKTKLQQKTDDVIEEIEERLPAFTYLPQAVVIQNPEEQKPTIYLGENNGRVQMPELTNLSPRTKELTLNGDTTFARNSDKIKSDGTKKIDTFVTELKPILDEMSDEQKIKINIVGHTDRTGNDKINIPLSRRRAESVKKYLEDTNRLGGNTYKTKIEYSPPDGRGSSECADNTCGNKKDCELCRKVVVTIEDISPKTEETE